MLQNSLIDVYALSHASFILGVSFTISGIVFALLRDLGDMVLFFEPIAISALGVMMLIGWYVLNSGVGEE